MYYYICTGHIYSSLNIPCSQTSQSSLFDRVYEFIPKLYSRCITVLQFQTRTVLRSPTLKDTVGCCHPSSCSCHGNHWCHYRVLWPDEWTGPSDTVIFHWEEEEEDYPSLSALAYAFTPCVSRISRGFCGRSQQQQRMWTINNHISYKRLLSCREIHCQSARFIKNIGKQTLW